MSTDLPAALAHFRELITALDAGDQLEYRLMARIEADEIRAVLAALEWRPIETAPITTDGTKPVYMLLGTRHHVGVGYRWPETDAEPHGGEEWWDECGQPIDTTPLGWLPLPPGPARKCAP